MKIWIEVEFKSHTLSSYGIKKGMWLDYEEFKDWEWLGDIKVKMSEEYYSSTIEFNFSIFEYSPERMERVRHFLNEVKNRYNLHISNNWGVDFVGTHIHFFDENFINKNKNILLQKVLAYTARNLDGLNVSSYLRLAFAHQLWAHYSINHQHFWKEWCNNVNREVLYSSSLTKKPKYSPIISSPATIKGKPRSLEIRIIPNEFIFDNRIDNLLSYITSRTTERITPSLFLNCVLSKLVDRNNISNNIRQYVLEWDNFINNIQGNV